MAVEAPSGLMGKPEDTEGFEAFEVNAITLYISKAVMEEEMKGNSLAFYLEGYGKYIMEILD